MAGEVVHFEMPYDDEDRATAFYRDVFGWDTRSMPEMGYTTVATGPADPNGRPSTPGYINGGMLGRQEPITAPVITIAVDDIDVALVRIEEHGGSTLRPRHAVGDMGFSAYIADSEGNVVGLWENAT